MIKKLRYFFFLTKMKNVLPSFFGVVCVDSVDPVIIDCEPLLPFILGAHTMRQWCARTHLLRMHGYTRTHASCTGFATDAVVVVVMHIVVLGTAAAAAAP